MLIRALSCVVCVMLFQICFGSLAASDDFGDGLADYRLENQDWNGLSEFGRIASTSGWLWRPVSGGLDNAQDAFADTDLPSLNAGRFGTDGVVVLVYPSRLFDAVPLLEWVEAGGNLLLCDDFGESGAILDVLGLARSVPARSETGSALHVLRENGSHPISNRVDTIVTNHPSAFRNELMGLFPFPDSGYLLYDLSLGDGRVIALSDPSILINAMLEAGDNRRLAENITRALCDTAQCPTLLLTGSQPADVDWDEVFDIDSARSEFSSAWQVDVETAVESFSELELDASSARIVILVLSLLSGFLLLTGFAFNRQRSSTGAPSSGSSGGRRQRLIRQLAQHRMGEQGGTVSLRTAELIGRVFTDDLREAFAIDDDDDTQVWGAALQLSPPQQRSLLESIIERLRTHGLVEQSRAAGLSPLKSQRSHHMDAKDFDELVVLMKRWTSIRQGDEATST